MADHITPSTSASCTSNSQEYTVRITRDRRKRFSVMRFGTVPAVDFTKIRDTPVQLEREDNFKNYKSANDLETQPKYGAGSEFGREQRNEARRKKYGITVKTYKAEDQPWHLKVGSGKQAKMYKGMREGTISDNASFYVFMQCANGVFEAFPVDQWYNFSPMIKYKYLDAEEAEEEFSRRDKTLNYFNIMLKRRVKNEEIDVDLFEEKKFSKSKASKAKRRSKDFMLTDMDDWADGNSDDEGSAEEDSDVPEKTQTSAANKTDKSSLKGKNKGKKSKRNSDDEAFEDSDEGDYDDREVDYMSDCSSSELSELEEKDQKYEDKGVSEEAGLRNILNSDDDDDEEEERDKEDDHDAEYEEGNGKKDKMLDEKRVSESSSSSSDSDSDIDKDDRMTSVLLMQGKSDKKIFYEPTHQPSPLSTSGGEVDVEKVLKRKADTVLPPAKKAKTELEETDLHLSSSSSSEGITEDVIRRYLQRKPMTTKDLLQKFRSKKLNLNNDQVMHTIVQLLKRINPDRTHVNKRLYLSLKKPE